MLFCCCIFLIAIAVGLGVGLSKKNDDDSVPTPAPAPTTPAPTPVPAPTAPPVRVPVSLPPRSPLPTIVPTSPPPFEPVIVESSADTTIYRDGFDAGGPQGSEETMLVQSGVPGNVDLPSAFSLVQFDLDSAIPSDFNTFLCLGHVQGDDIDEESSVTYRACSLPPTDVDIESLTGSDAPYTIPDDCVSEVALFEVTPQDDVICINVASTLGSQRVRLRGRQRQLQSSTSYLFMLDSPPGSQQPGDRFYTRNSAETLRRPTLEVGTDFPETDIPTTNLTSTLPPDTGDFPPCGVCAEGEEVTLPDASLPVPPELLPPGIEPAQATCSFVNQFCEDGGCSEEICTTIEQAAAAIGPICGCSVEI
ncbi:MAG: hypothetical protein SGARI_001231 [Bacillariaceae sp.]